MKPRFLIFPCVFSDFQFEIIQKVRDQLLSCKLDLATLCLLNSDVRLLKVDCIISDLSELLGNKISKGWRYNSYVLNLAVVKLDYAQTILELDLNVSSSPTVTVISHSFDTLSQILSDCYVDYINEEF